MPSQESSDSTDADPVRAVSERSPEGGKKKIKRPKPPLPRTEREIDAPDRVTLLMLGVMGFMTIVLWAFAKGGCNYHPPRETRRPRAVKTEELARDPKGAALELQQRLIQYDFDGALELAADAAETDVKQRKTECASKVKECAENKKKNERVATTAALLERDMASAVVRATSTTPRAKAGEHFASRAPWLHVEGRVVCARRRQLQTEAARADGARARLGADAGSGARRLGFAEDGAHARRVGSSEGVGFRTQSSRSGRLRKALIFEEQERSC